MISGSRVRFVPTAGVGDVRNEYKIIAGEVKKRDHLPDIGIDGRITLK
jgi:hypothetical protein